MTIRREMIGVSTTAAPARTEWSWPSNSPSHHRRDRDSAHSPSHAYSHSTYNTRPFQRIPQSSSTSSAGPADIVPSQPINFNFFHFQQQQQPFHGHPGVDPGMNHHDLVDGWVSHFTPSDYTPFLNHDGLPIEHSLPMQVPHTGFGLSWEIPSISSMSVPPHSENHDTFVSDCLETRGSVSSVALSTPQTAASSMSDGWVFPMSSPSYGSPGGSGGKDVAEISQPEERISLGPAMEHNFVPYGKPSSPIGSDDFSFEGDGVGVSHITWNLADNFGADTVHWSPANQMPQATASAPPPSSIPHDPFGGQLHWTPQETHVDNFNENLHPSFMSFHSPQEVQFPAYKPHEEPVQVATPIRQEFGPPPTPKKRERDTEWEEVRPSTYATSYSSHSYSPPISRNTPSQTSSPSQNSPSPRSGSDVHSHVFSAFPSPQKRRPQRGRVRPLTNQEKRNAREVRLAGACWACHLSKIRCSPCSPGAPCEQCTRLSGKRRFCLLPCFNDPLEALNTFLVPDYLMGHFTRANVENFVNRNASAWGQDSFVVQMSWGFQRPLKATVVTLTMSGPSSELAYWHDAEMNGTKAPTLTTRESPPVGVPLAGMAEMEAEYAAYVKDIVMNDLDYYADEAYADDDSEFAELLLKAVCDFYTAGLEADEECDLLRQAIEIHVTCIILERSLKLDDESLQTVETALGQRYEPRSAPRCAQRQIKLALFNQQRQRIISVLAKWGSLMWTSNGGTTNERKWAIGFSVFLVLTLVIDKTLGAAYVFCENRIKNLGFEAESERAKFEQLGRLTETELFERCKEILHSRFKTRKAGKESCNPIRDGNGAWRGKPVDARTDRFVQELQAIVGEFGDEVRSHRSILPDESEPFEDCQYLDSGRLACILLDDFLDH